MADVAVGQRLLLTIAGRYFGQRTMNSFLFRCSATAAGVSQAAAIAALHAKLGSVNDFFAKYTACLPGESAEVTGLEAWYQIIAPVRYRKTVLDIPFNASTAYNSTTANVSASIERFSELAVRKGVGGIRVPIGTSGVANGLIGDDLLLDLEGFAEILNDLQTTASPSVTWVPQVGLPGYTPGDPPTPGNPMLSLDCVGATVKGEARIVRRRTVGLGE